MPEANPKEASVSLDETDRRVKIVFEHLPRVGDTIIHENALYLVDRIAFNVVQSEVGLFGYPNLYCVPNK